MYVCVFVVCVFVCMCVCLFAYVCLYVCLCAHVCLCVYVRVLGMKVLYRMMDRSQARLPLMVFMEASSSSNSSSLVWGPQELKPTLTVSAPSHAPLC